MELTCLSRKTVYLNGKLLDIKNSLARVNHSPTGFSWGYHGSGPAQLALAVMMEMLEGSEYSPDGRDVFNDEAYDSDTGEFMGKDVKQGKGSILSCV